MTEKVKEYIASLRGKKIAFVGMGVANAPSALFLNDSVPEEHKAGIDMRRDMLRRSHTLIVCGSAVDEDVKNDIAVAGRLGIAATTLEGVLAVKGHGTPGHAGH